LPDKIPGKIIFSYFLSLYKNIFKQSSYFFVLLLRIKVSIVTTVREIVAGLQYLGTFYIIARMLTTKLWLI